LLDLALTLRVPLAAFRFEVDAAVHLQGEPELVAVEVKDEAANALGRANNLLPLPREARSRGRGLGGEGRPYRWPQARMRLNG
jgi:hypothetical protein